MSFNLIADDYESDGFAPLPNGWKEAIVTHVMEQENKSASGRWVMLEFTIKSGPSKGRVVKNFFNYINRNEDTQRISREQLAEAIRILGLKSLSIPDELGALMNKTIAVNTMQKSGEDFPQIKGYRKADDGLSGLEDQSFTNKPRSNRAWEK